MGLTSSGGSGSITPTTGLMPSIQFSPLRQQLADAIQQDLAKGTWKETLPGLRQLALRYGVSKRTCAEALKLLERAGKIPPAMPRSRRQLPALKHIKSGKRPLGQLLIICDLSERTRRTTDLFLAETTKFWTGRGGMVRTIEVDYTRRRSPAKLLKNWFEGESVECVILIRSTGPWAMSVDSLGIPVFMLGGIRPKGTRHCTQVGFHLREALGEVLAFLKNHGHSKILMPWPGASQRLHSNCIEIFMNAFNGLSQKAAEAMVPAVDILSGKDWASFWSKALASKKPSCVIVGNGLEAVALVSFCATRGISIPQQISVFVLDGGELMEWFTPALAHLKMDDASEAKAFMQWVTNGYPDKGSIPTDYDLVPGASVAMLR